MLAILVLLGITAIVAAISLQALMAADRMQRVQRTTVLLEAVRLGITDADANTRGFRQRVFQHPGALSQLALPITKSLSNSCGNSYGNPQVNNWTNNGSFGGILVDPGLGLATPIGTGDDALIRSPVAAKAGTLFVNFPSVDVRDAILLDALYDDGNGSSNIGAVKGVLWSVPSADGQTNMKVGIIVDGVC